MFKRLFVVVLFMVLSVTVLPDVAKADAYDYENISELVDSIASVINNKNTYAFKYKFDRSDLRLNLDVDVNWKTKTTSFNGFIFRQETDFKKEKFSAVLDLKNNKVKTSSKAYKKGNNILSALIEVWDFEKDDEEMKSLGHYLLGVLSFVDNDTTVDVSGDSMIANKINEANGTIYYTTVILNKSKVMKLEGYTEDNMIQIRMK